MGRSLLKTLVILTWVASCMGDKCWWQPGTICEDSTCNNAHYMWRARDGQFFCPQSEGHDVVLCEHPSWMGACHASHIPKGQNCTNVDSEMNDRASSVHTLGGCIRLYEKENCEGKWKVYDRGTVGHNDLSDMHDLVSAVGLCTPEDHPQGGCSQATPEGRLECKRNNCYWLGEPDCGDSGTCGTDHFMWSGFNHSTCVNQSTKYCCPSGDGQDVVLCQHNDLKGECVVTHIPRGKSCAEVQINDWANSVHSLGGCVKLFKDTNCGGQVVVFDKDTVGHNLPPEMSGQVTSVGRCPADELEDYSSNIIPKSGRFRRLAAIPESATQKDCALSSTIVNGKRACKNSVVFFDDFQTLDSDKWVPEIRVCSKPDHEFTVYNDKPENMFVKDGNFHLKPTVYNETFVENGEIMLKRCTGDAFENECSRTTDFNILPPVQSARLTTHQKFNFTYGVVEIQAQFPVGDWIVADIRLAPANDIYGPHYESGLVRVMSRGNSNLKKPDGENMGTQTVESAVMLGYGTNVQAKSAYFRRDSGWQNELHKFTIIWTPEDIAFLVDGKERQNTMKNTKGSRLSDVIGLPGANNKIWSTGTPIAPFDQPFYLSLGVSVGGIRDFEEGWTNNGKPKPWSNTNPRALLSFWDKRKEWQPTWGQNSAFKIKSVKVTAL